MIDALPRLQDDGLFTPDVGIWGEFKYRVMANYSSMFASSMKGKWDCRVYIDLFAGAGRAQIEGTSQIVAGSPFIALGVKDPFDKYIFCEENPECFAALRQRVAAHASDRDVTLIDGNCNDRIADIINAVPAPRAGFKVLSFCFVDPFNIGNLHFETIRRLSALYIDFLVLIATHMDANRNPAAYVAPDNTTIADFLGDTAWRESWKAVEVKGERFGLFVADAFGQQMKAMNYKYNGLGDMFLVRNKEKNAPLYHLALFSRSDLANKFWKEARKYSKDQLDLF